MVQFYVHVFQYILVINAHFFFNSSFGKIVRESIFIYSLNIQFDENGRCMNLRICVVGGK